MNTFKTINVLWVHIKYLFYNNDLYRNVGKAVLLKLMIAT